MTTREVVDPDHDVLEYKSHHPNEGSGAIASALELSRGRSRSWLDGCIELRVISEFSPWPVFLRLLGPKLPVLRGLNISDSFLSAVSYYPDENRPMATANGAAVWTVRRAVGVPLFLLIQGTIISMLAAPGLVVINHTYPEAMPFAWLALIITLLTSIGHARRHGIDTAIIDRLEALDTAEKYQYLLNLMFITAGIVTFHVGVTALIGAAIAIYLGYPVAGLAFVIAYPALDAYFGRRYDASFGTLGYYLASSLLELLSWISVLSPSSTEAAAQDVKAAI